MLLGVEENLRFAGGISKDRTVFSPVCSPFKIGKISSLYCLMTW